MSLIRHKETESKTQWRELTLEQQKVTGENTDYRDWRYSQQVNVVKRSLYKSSSDCYNFFSEARSIIISGGQDQGMRYYCKV